jgi:hypothetical protein
VVRSADREDKLPLYVSSGKLSRRADKFSGCHEDW